MIVMYSIMFFFILLVNVLLSNLLFRVKIDNKIFNNSNLSNLSTVSCIMDHWFLISKSFVGLDLRYVERDNNYLKCTETPSENDLIKSCGLSGKYNNKREICYLVLSTLLSNVSING